jgi:hypothetical protein
MNKYACMYINKKNIFKSDEIDANSTYEACKRFAEKLNLKNTIGISAMLIKKDNTEIIHNADF